MKNRQKQINIVVSYLCSKQANKNGRLTITDKDTQFLAKHGCDLGSCLQEFKNREYIKYHAPAIFIHVATHNLKREKAPFTGLFPKAILIKFRRVRCEGSPGELRRTVHTALISR